MVIEMEMYIKFASEINKFVHQHKLEGQRKVKLLNSLFMQFYVEIPLNVLVMKNII